MHSVGQGWKVPVSCTSVAGVGKFLQDCPASPSLPVDGRDPLQGQQPMPLFADTSGLSLRLEPTTPFPQGLLGGQQILCPLSCLLDRTCQVRSSVGQGLALHVQATPRRGTPESRLQPRSPRCACGSAGGSRRALPLLALERSRGRNARSRLAILPLTDSLLRVECRRTSLLSLRSRLLPRAWLFSLLHFQVQRNASGSSAPGMGSSP